VLKSLIGKVRATKINKEERGEEQVLSFQGEISRKGVLGLKHKQNNLLTFIRREKRHKSEQFSITNRSCRN